MGQGEGTAPQRKPLRKRVGERRREQEAAPRRRRLILVGAAVAVVVVVAVPWGWRTVTDPGPQPTAAQTVSAYFDAQATGDCELLRDLLTKSSWSQDGELSADEFVDECEVALIGFRPITDDVQIDLVGDGGEYDLDDHPTQGLVTLSSSEAEGRTVREGGRWRIEIDPEVLTLGASIEDRVRAYVDAYNAGDCDLLHRQLADATWSQDGGLSADEFAQRCAAEVGRNAERRPLIVDAVDLGPNPGADRDTGGSERRVDVGLHRVGDASLAGHLDRVELVREGLAWKVTAIPDSLAETSDQGDTDDEEDDTEEDPDTGGQVGTPGTDVADASGRVVPAFEWVELQDDLVYEVDLGRGHRCWSYEDRPTGYPDGVPPMIGIERAFGDCAGEVRVSVRAFPDDGEAQRVAERLVDDALAADPTAVETQVPGLDDALGARGRGAVVNAVRDGWLVSVEIESGGSALALAAATVQAQLEDLA